ncbi:MAG: hypothetical protein GXO35_04650 [Gammaproteobacteria bacterium]|nr:hypothetical protein [Gammaproteobacteria bacterium]
MLKQIMSLPNGARFYKCDLHTHTPFDNRFNCEGWPVDTEEQKLAFAKELVKHVRQEHHLDILGVTEHNDVSWLPYIQDAAKEDDLIIFPGVELSVLSGKKNIHLLVLFDPETEAIQIDHWLSSLGLTPGQRFHPDNTPRVVQKTFHELLRYIHQHSDLPGIVIAAHASSKSGLFRDLEGEARVLAYTDKHLLAVEIPGSRDELSEFEKKLVNGELDNYQRKRVACLNHSDGRGLQDRADQPAIGSKATYIKLSSPTIEGLRQAFLDFESRIRLEDDRHDEHYSRLIGIAIEGGFLSKEKEKGEGIFLLHFNPNLNCVIGGRGAGKSALLESIRYVFDISAKTESSQRQSDEILRNTLGAGAKITAFYETSDGVLYRIERIWEHDPRVFDAKTGEEKQGLHPNRLVPGGSVEVYSQKEVYEISKDPAFQLRLLDNYVAEALRLIWEEERDLIRSLQENAQEILRLEQEVDEASEKLSDLPVVREELNRLERQQIVVQIERKKQLEQEKAMLEQASDKVKELVEETRSFANGHEIPSEILDDEVRAGLPHAEMLARQRALLDEIGETFRQSLENLPDRLQDIWNKGADERSAWQKEYQEEDEKYQALLREVPDVSAERYIELQKRRNDLEQLAKEAERQRERVVALKEKRREMLLELRRLRREKEFPVRKAKALELDTSLGEAIKIEVVLEGNRDIYIQHLRESFSGVSAGITKSVLESIAKTKGDSEIYYDPIHLVEAIHKEREQPSESDSILYKVYNISEAYRRRLATLPDETLYALETYRVPDLPVIKLRVGEQYKPLSELSIGQKCTAILSLILMERKTPLVIDQPEDDLDNRFVFDEIVQALRQEKERRQFIIATHNANIPVSGDAELIIVLDANETHGWITSLGSIDDLSIREPVENILEGGREAFRIRKEKYGI